MGLSIRMRNEDVNITTRFPFTSTEKSKREVLFTAYYFVLPHHVMVRLISVPMNTEGFLFLTAKSLFQAEDTVTRNYKGKFDEILYV